MRELMAPRSNRDRRDPNIQADARKRIETPDLADDRHAHAEGLDLS
jgi:hypothetical protein